MALVGNANYGSRWVAPTLFLMSATLRWSPEAHRRLSAQRHQRTWIPAYAGMTVKCLRDAISEGMARKTKQGTQRWARLASFAVLLIRSAAPRVIITAMSRLRLLVVSDR
jgi:hypothetical protein